MILCVGYFVDYEFNVAELVFLWLIYPKTKILSG